MIPVLRFIISLIFLTAAYPFNLSAQQQYLFSHLHIHDGLASEVVNSVAQDDKGFIWIATNNGLQRYDNKSFLSFYHKDGDSASLPINRVTWLKKDTRNRLWLLLEDNKIGYFNTSNFTFHEVQVNAPESLLHKLDGRLFTDSLGNVIFLLNGYSFYTYNEKQDKFLSSSNPFVMPSNWQPYWLYYDHPHRSYWIGCDSGLVKYNVNKKTLSYNNHNADNDEIIRALSGIKVILQPLFDKSGKFWVVSWYDNNIHIISYDTKTLVKQEWQKNLYALNKGWYFEITSIVEQKDGTLWLTGPNMFAHFNRSTNSFEFIKTNQPGEFSILYDGVNTVYEDRDYNLWVCSDKGLYRFNPAAQLFHTYLNRPFGKDTTYLPDVSGFIQLSNGDFLVSTWGNGLFAYDSLLNPVKRNYIEQAAHLYEGMVWCIHQRKNGDIWRGNQGGYLYIYHDSTKTTTRLIPEIFNGSTIRQIAEDDKGNLWLGTQSGLVVKWIADNNTFIKVQKFNSPVNRLYFDKKNNLWVCLRNDGIACLNTIDGNLLHRYTTTEPIGKKLMISGADDIVQYNDSLYLIASGGINILNINKNNIRFNNPSNPVFTNTVSNLIFDKAGTLWITSANGVFVMNMQTEVASDFNENDGIQPEGVNTGASYMLPDGRIAFGRAHDFIIFKPEDVLGINFMPPVVTITGFKVMGNTLQTDSLQQQKNIVFPHDQNAVIIQFSTLDYRNNYAIFYKLEGLDKDWTLTTTGKEAIYNYLPPGNYIFKVYAQNSDGLKSKKITDLKFTIETPFWQTWWFYALLALFAVALLYWYDRDRMKRKAAVQLMRSNISDNLHTEVNSALQDINMLSEIASLKAGNEPVQSKNYISEINYKSRNMITAMDDMLWSIDPSNDTMDKFIARAKEFAASLSYSNNANVEIQSDKQVHLLKPDMQLRHELMMMYKLGLNWLVNELSSKQTIVQLNYINHQLQLNMFAAEVKAGISELTVIEKKFKERANEINATLDVLSDEKGVAIIMNIKI